MTKNPSFPKDNEIENYVNTQKIIMNKKRLRILFMLNKDFVTWSEFMIKLDIRNPKLLHDHISILSSSNLITKNKDGFYCLTNLGRAFITANLPLIKKLGKLVKPSDD